MYQSEYKGINDFLKESCKLLLAEGKKRETRGNVCYELTEPYMFKINNPSSRWITIPERKWYATLPYAESLWLASGRNDMEFIRSYLKRMDNFSDNKLFMRGGYGPRLRHFNGNIKDYQIADFYLENSLEVDQFRYVLECFKNDIETRRAVINIGDPMKDNFDEDNKLKETLDIPCTRMLHFIKDSSSNKLNLIVSMRSNDIIWGASAVNIFNFTFMQEYFAAMLGLDIGYYIHISNNFHYYQDKKQIVENIANGPDTTEEPYIYNKSFKSLEDFDKLVKEISQEEILMREQKSNYKYHEFSDDFFRDWYNVLYTYHIGKQVNFINPLLKDLRFKI